MTKPPHIGEEAARLKAIYQERKKADRSLTQEKLADMFGWSTQSAVSQYMTGAIELNFEALMKFASALDFQPEEVSPRLVKGIELPRFGRRQQQALKKLLKSKSAASDVDTAIGPAGRLLPVIGYVQAGAFCEAIDSFHPGDAEEWDEAGGPAGPHAFILRIEGFSMEPDFKPGDKVVIDPDMQWKSGDFVLAKRVSDQAVTLKQLRQEGGEFYLYATNPAWPERIIRLTEEWHVCGRARRKIVDL